MPLIFITGISGSGKSTVRRELRNRDYEAYGTDEDGLAHWVNSTTGAVTLTATANDRSVEFMASNDWRFDVGLIGRLAQTAEDKLVFVCGAVQTKLMCGIFSET